MPLSGVVLFLLRVISGGLYPGKVAVQRMKFLDTNIAAASFMIPLSNGEEYSETKNELFRSGAWLSLYT